jgi:hypothetical protein
MDQTSMNRRFVKRRSEEVNSDMPEIFPFPISIPERDLSDLRARLDLTRLPEPETVPDATQGIELEELRVSMELRAPQDRYDFNTSKEMNDAV